MQTYTDDFEPCSMTIIEETTISPYDSEYKDHYYDLGGGLYIDSDGELQVYIGD